MGSRFKFNLLPSLLAGEKVLFFKGWIWAASALSLPNYRWAFSLPPVCEAALYVTDRRILYIAHILRLLTVEFDQWFEGKQEPEESELVKDVSVGRNLLLGPYLEVVSESLVRLWFRSRRCRMRVYMRKPELVYQVISEAMTESSKGS